MIVEVTGHGYVDGARFGGVLGGLCGGFRVRGGPFGCRLGIGRRLLDRLQDVLGLFGDLLGALFRRGVQLGKRGEELGAPFRRSPVVILLRSVQNASARARMRSRAGSSAAAVSVGLLTAISSFRNSNSRLRPKIADGEYNAGSMPKYAAVLSVTFS